MLAARGLPWWMVGLSMFATAVDSGDYVAVAGAAYQNGMNFITDWWLGITIGWFLVAWAVFLPMYRSGMFTNAEYLERRFGPSSPCDLGRSSRCCTAPTCWATWRTRCT